MTCRVCNRATLTHCGWHECPRPKLSLPRRETRRVDKGGIAWMIAAYAVMGAVWWIGRGVWW